MRGTQGAAPPLLVERVVGAQRPAGDQAQQGEDAVIGARGERAVGGPDRTARTHPGGVDVFRGTRPASKPRRAAAGAHFTTNWSLSSGDVSNCRSSISTRQAAAPRGTHGPGLHCQLLRSVVCTWSAAGATQRIMRPPGRPCRETQIPEVPVLAPPVPRAPDANPAPQRSACWH